ncbi:MAG: FlgD immunoglobulin-like domain containing protein, partial [Candidatus Krumholzibacteriota bacterium]
QAGWYVMMTNLHETAWHDYMGGPISGWQHKYSAHIKNAMIYAEASHWANGEYVTTTDAYAADIDNDGYQETVLHNDHLFAVFEGAGGRMTHLFVKGSGYDDTAIGVDNAYWADTDGDFNDVNHVGAFSEVSPNYQHDGYGVTVTAGGTTASVELIHNEVTKTINLNEGDSFFDIVYEVGPATHWIQGGFSPSLVDLVWNGELNRVWPTDGSYMGFRNPNTGIATSWVLGSGGAEHQKEISGTLMKGDEIKGSGVFQIQLFAGPTSAPDGAGDIAELRLLADNLTDTLGPAVDAAAYYPATDRLRVTLDQAAGTVLPASFSVYDGLVPLSSITLPMATPVTEALPSQVLTFELDSATAAAVEAMTGPDLYLVASAGAVTDESGNPSDAVTTGDGIVIEMIQTVMAIDGNIEAGEWADAQALADSNDTAWGPANEIDRLLVHWDSDFLYLAIDGQVTSNSWLLYLDVDPGTANGETDLTAIDAWERGASFTASGFAADFQYGCYQHQSAFDGDGFWQLLSPTTTQDRSGDIQSAFDSFHTFGSNSGSELAIPWNTLYGLGEGLVPVDAEISLVASICWDPEPDGVLGGDSVPSNAVAALPVIDNVWTLTVDSDGDGLPDVDDPSPVPFAPGTAARLLPNIPNPFNPSTLIRFEIPGPAAADVNLAVYDVRGNRINTLVRGVVEPGLHEVVWNGRTGGGLPVAAGTYFSQLRCRGLVINRPLSLVK